MKLRNVGGVGARVTQGPSPSPINRALVMGGTFPLASDFQFEVNHILATGITLSLPPFAFHRFDTGFLILSLLMDRKEELVNWLPVEQLWPLLIAVSCQHTGQERLKVIGLLMDIVCLMSEGADEKWKAKLKLSTLKPLWQLYTTVIKEFGEGLGWAVAARAQEMASPRERGPLPI